MSSLTLSFLPAHIHGPQSVFMIDSQLESYCTISRAPPARSVILPRLHGPKGVTTIDSELEHYCQSGASSRPEDNSLLMLANLSPPPVHFGQFCTGRSLPCYMLHVQAVLINTVVLRVYNFQLYQDDLYSEQHALLNVVVCAVPAD